MKHLLLIALLLSLSACTSTLSPPKKEYTVYLDKTFVDHLDFKGQDLKAVRLHGQWYYVRQDGKAMPVMLNEEGNVDVFKEGLARIRLNGKVGFFDQSLEVVLEPLYDYAFPFHNGVAEICLGCHELASDGSSLLDGGTWKRIDRTGLVLEE